jgi:hypothetical protein
MVDWRSSKRRQRRGGHASKRKFAGDTGVQRIGEGDDRRTRVVVGAARGARLWLCVAVLMGCVVECCGFSALFADISRGWILRRCEEAAVLVALEKLALNTAEIWYDLKEVLKLGQGRGNNVLYSRVGRTLRMAEQLQLIVLMGIFHKVQ